MGKVAQHLRHLNAFFIKACGFNFMQLNIAWKTLSERKFGYNVQLIISVECLMLWGLTKYKSAVSKPMEFNVWMKV